jgi:hypothetical protein
LPAPAGRSAGEQASASGDYQLGLQPFSLSPRDGQTEVGQPVIPAPLIVVTGVGSFFELFDETALQQPGERAVQGSRMQTRSPRRSSLDIPKDAVPVLFSARKGEQNLERDGRERKECARSKSIHVHLYMCDGSIRLGRIVFKQKAAETAISDCGFREPDA